MIQRLTEEQRQIIEARPWSKSSLAVICAPSPLIDSRALRRWWLVLMSNLWFSSTAGDALPKPCGWQTRLL